MVTVEVPRHPAWTNRRTERTNAGPTLNEERGHRAIEHRSSTEMSTECSKWNAGPK